MPAIIMPAIAVITTLLSLVAAYTSTADGGVVVIQPRMDAAVVLLVIAFIAATLSVVAGADRR